MSGKGAAGKGGKGGRGKVGGKKSTTKSAKVRF